MQSAGAIVQALDVLSTWVQDNADSLGRDVHHINRRVNELRSSAQDVVIRLGAGTQNQQLHAAYVQLARDARNAQR